MTHPNLQTNGASLEDCHTNFFALTELSGIKWRKLVWCEGGGVGGAYGGAHPAGSGGGEPLEDVVLRSYARCLAADILCVWRRVSAPQATHPFDLVPPPPSQPPPLSLAAAKELWIFWYGEEPDLKDLIAPDLLQCESEQGSWESGLSYECRSLLFKALHNLIERCLLSRDFIRIGKWFVQPHTGSRKPTDASSVHLSFSFAFFVHGDSSVCASVDVRQHPPVRKLCKSHLHQAQASTSGLQVILAPFGLAGTITGQTFKNCDNARLLEDWGHFFPLDKNYLQSPTENGVVEVIVGGMKMRYPSGYVLVTDIDDTVNNSAPTSVDSNVTTPLVTITNTNSSANGTTKHGNGDFSNIPSNLQTPPASPVPINSKVPHPGPFPVSVEHPASMQRPSTAASVFPERVWQECMLGQAGTAQGSSGPGEWDFVDPLKRVICSCSRCRKYVGSMTSSKWASPRPCKGARGRIPFHRRSPVPPENDRCVGSCTPHGGPPSYPRTQESLAIPSVGSPQSAAPSPLPNPSSEQPASVPPNDQGMLIMPTLSPIPSTTGQSPAEKVLNTQTPEQPPKSTGSIINSPHPLTETKCNGANENSNLTTSTLTAPILKRPTLSSKEYESAVGEEDLTLDLLYDFSTLNAWLNHPVKKIKLDSKDIQRNNRSNKDLYSMFKQNGDSLTNNDLSVNNIRKEPFLIHDIKQEPGLEMETETTILPGHGIKRPGDPYDFEEEGPNSDCHLDSFKRTGITIKEEPKDVKKDLRLLTNEDLQPSFRDLDEIFEHSDDTSSDEALHAHIQTPPDSNKSIGHHDDNKRLSGHSSGNTSGGSAGAGCSLIGGLRPEELSKMFPTPPSLEHNPIASPIGQQDLPQPDLTELSLIRKQDIYPNTGSPQEENIDWSFVFKPGTVCKMVGSSKYAPLTNLPSQTLPPVIFPSTYIYKPSWEQHTDRQAQQTNRETSTQQPSSTTPATSNPKTNTVQHILSQQQQQTQPQQPQQSSQLSQQPSIPQLPPGMLSGIHGNFPSSPLPPNFRPPPPPYELPSPATSTASSYLNKNLNSVEPVSTPTTVQRTPEASSLLVNILLTDTALNIFRDHNFDSCTLCVCNAGSKSAGNIKGADAGVYLMNGQGSDRSVHQPNSPYQSGMGQPPPYGMLSPPHHPHTPGIDEDAVRCSCGFSAVVNRRLSHRSGLFYEDEMEITGIAEDPGELKKTSMVSFLLSTSTTKQEPGLDRDQLDVVPHSVLDLVRDQCVMIQSTANSLYRIARFLSSQPNVNGVSYSNTINSLEFRDGNDVTSVALEQSKHPDSLPMCKMEETIQRRNSHSISVHRWPFLRACGPQCNQDIIRMMKNLQPLLQEAIQKKSQTKLWDAPSAVKGPLTWRQFHRLAGRGTNDRCEPQPIPSLIVGHEKDWLSLSPYALQYWESLLLEPYSYPRDVAYIVVAPDNDAILPRVRTFFKELSSAYEMCRLGRHCPITKILREGILRVGKTAKIKIGNEPVEDWFTLLGEGEATDMLRLYAQVCKHHLAPHLQQLPMDKSLLDQAPEIIDKSMPSPMPPPSTPDSNTQSSDKAPSTPKSEQSDQEGLSSKDIPQSSGPSLDIPHDDEESETPAIVIYLVDPFSMGTDQPEFQRIACLALLRCFQSVLNSVPENIRSNISVQIISQESIIELGKARERFRFNDHMRSLALSIFSQSRRLLMHTNSVKSLTGFGTAAMCDLFLKNKDEKNRAPYKMYTPPYVLAPLKEKVESIESFGQATEQASVLYLSYCLSEDQSWLLAVVTDERGEIFETIMINIDIPNRSRRKKASARRVGLLKLMDFVLGVMSQNVKPWRLVVGRLGRIGHGELKGWSHLLSGKNLQKASKHLKEICTQCSLTYPSTVPCILSACLVSLEPDSVLRLLPDQFTPDERFSQISINSQLSTPQDVTCTHVLVFPTSATTQSTQSTFQETHLDTGDLGDDELFPVDEIDEIDDLNDIFNWSTGPQSPTGREEFRPDSPSNVMNAGHQDSPFQCAGNQRNNEPVEEVGAVLQQPLALGYLVSTAPTGKMPKWFWSSCPHLEGVCPAFLKNALHLHSPNIQRSEDLLPLPHVTSHPLDSQYTTDVLRYVLEGYNALSWLVLDSNTRDRLSCLPVHIQVLIQLYHTTAALL
ncbi:mediator of RNA polymerase II transcription subunit 13 isoform X2 [Onthophagus taurus]|uniref:mediator of RNA polymerase II transcription subunit 13 isoform X2 n=1 Tax=Onthophagus taurus TaxID=166361 RepID=UPI000C202AFE|nr:mediator of RNA polymerase II transcription subunit 13 isoform X2 [Onthophagus taurus]